jgi:hypothetical protein
MMIEERGSHTKVLKGVLDCKRLVKKIILGLGVGEKIVRGLGK